MAKEYIEREAAKSELLSWAVCMNHPEYLMRDDALHVIDSIPVADAVPVVRCRECKYRFRNNGHEKSGCPIIDTNIWMDDDDFCSYGEQKESADC